MAPLTVACVLRSGGDFDAEYVSKLQAGVARNLTVRHTFLCLSDCPVPCARMPLETDWPGWWAKIELFRLLGPVLYFDLDTVITGSLDEIASYPHEFTMLRDVGRYTRPMSGVMAWEGDYRGIYRAFAEQPELHMKYYTNHEWGSQGGPWGDGGFIATYVERPEIFQDIFPGQIVSYKWQTPEERKGARVVCYHGPPRPRETGWAA